MNHLLFSFLQADTHELLGLGRAMDFPHHFATFEFFAIEVKGNNMPQQSAGIF
jgi:hypothetical protein